MKAAQPHIEPDPPAAEGERGVLSQLGTGQQWPQVKLSGRLMSLLGRKEPGKNRNGSIKQK